MDYNHIENFLQKFKKLLSNSEATNTIIAETISKYTAITVDPGVIKTKGSIIYIQGSPMFRNEVLMRTEKILSELKTTLPERRFTNIR
jgi:hypothetical protein